MRNVPRHTACICQNQKSHQKKNSSRYLPLQLELRVSTLLVMGMPQMDKGRSPCWGMNFSAEGGGGEAGAHRLESNTPRKMAKNVQKNVWTFLSCKNVQMGRNIFLNIFFNRGMKLQITKRSPGGTKCTYEVLASQTKNKKESRKVWLQNVHRRHLRFFSVWHSCQFEILLHQQTVLNVFIF